MINNILHAAKLIAVVAIPMDYPDSPPLFSIELDWHGKHNRIDSEVIRVRRLFNIFFSFLLYNEIFNFILEYRGRSQHA